MTRHMNAAGAFPRVEQWTVHEEGHARHSLRGRIVSYPGIYWEIFSVQCHCRPARLPVCGIRNCRTKQVALLTGRITGCVCARARFTVPRSAGLLRSIVAGDNAGDNVNCVMYQRGTNSRRFCNLNGRFCRERPTIEPSENDTTSENGKGHV